MILRVTRVQYYKDCKPRVLPIRETTEPNLERLKKKLGDKQFGLLMVTGCAQIIKDTPPKPDSKWTPDGRRYIYELIKEAK